MGSNPIEALNFFRFHTTVRIVSLLNIITVVVTVDFSLLWPRRFWLWPCQVRWEIRNSLLICQLHLSVSQPNCKLCFKFHDLSIKKFGKLKCRCDAVV